MLTDFFVLSASVAAVAFTIAMTKVTATLRVKIAMRSDWFGNLASCPYCLSHWLSFGAVAVYRIKIIDRVPVMDYIVTAMAMVMTSAALMGLIIWTINQMKGKR